MTSDSARGLVLVVEDERAISDLLRLYLSREGFGVHVEANGRSALSAARTMHPSAIVLDVGLPEMDGTEVCRELRAEGNWVPILFCTARDDEVDRVLGLELGADDYIIKPFDPAEVVARIRARLRRGRTDPGRATRVARFAGWRAEFDRYLLVGPDGTEVPMSHAEGEVLRLFLESPKRLISRAQMQESLGGAAGESFDRAMDVRISRLRTKLGEDPKNPRLIKTIYGAGYIFLGDVNWD